jgi:hypothetical protein
MTDPDELPETVDDFEFPDDFDWSAGDLDLEN